MGFMMSCDGMKPLITSGGGGGGLKWPNKMLFSLFRIFNAAGKLAGGDLAMHTIQKDRLTALFSLLQASDVA